MTEEELVLRAFLRAMPEMAEVAFILAKRLHDSSETGNTV